MQVKKQQLELDMERQTDSKLGKAYNQGCILSPYLFNLYAEDFMWNAGLDEAQARIKIARRNIDNLSCADATTLMLESKELKRFLMRVKEESEKAALKLSIQNVGLDESQAGIKTARRNINNLKYVDDTTLMAESEEEHKNLLMRVKEES